MTLRVLVVDDHAVVREGIRAVLERKSPATRVAEAADGAAAIAACRARPFDIVVMDVSMPGMDGVTATRALMGLDPAPRVLALSMHGEHEFVRAMLRAGARGYLLKSAITEELVMAIDAIAQGQNYFGASTVATVIDDYVTGLRREEAAAGVSPSAPRLSGRELEVLRLVAEGKSAKEAASVLGVSPRTVEMHRAHLMRKLGVNSATALVRSAIARGLIEG